MALQRVSRGGLGDPAKDHISPREKEKGREKAKERQQSLPKNRHEAVNPAKEKARKIRAAHTRFRPLPTAGLWRHPTLLLALQNRQEWTGAPCWEQMGCSESVRTKCPSYRISGGKFCWLVASNECQRARQSNVRGVLNCLGCGVLGRYINGPATRGDPARLGLSF